MILTLTPNPSIDATLVVDKVVHGEVFRAISALREAGGKGVNVSSAVKKAGLKTLAIAPCGKNDPFRYAIAAAEIPFHGVEIDGIVRTNTAITEKDGTTTKINELGPEFLPTVQTAVERTVTEYAAQADAIVLAGSLPPQAPDNWYAVLIKKLRDTFGDESPLIAVDTSDAPLVALGESMSGAAPDIMKPNAFELGQLTGANGHELEAQAERGEFEHIIDAARQLIAKGCKEVLVTLGGAGACLITADGAWGATPPPITVRSTVAAGDSSLAGYVMARVAGKPFDECLKNAVAYGSAAASLPGTGVPSPQDLDREHTSVFAISTSDTTAHR